MSSHEVITLSQGETMTYDGGNLVENIIFDCTADDCALRISPSGDDWTMRNVGVRGTFDRGSGINTYRTGQGDGFAELITNDEANNSGNTITIEHCYFGDGCEPGVDLSFMTSSGSHAGHMEIVDSYFAGWNTAALYIAGAARSDESGGTYAVRRCYLHDNNIASVRIATDGSIVEDCVIFNNHEIPWATFFGPLNEDPPSDEAQIAGRCIWSSYGDAGQTVDVVNCEIDGTTSSACPPSYGFPSDADDTSCFGHAVNGSDSSFHIQGGNVIGPTPGSVTTDGNVGNDPNLTPPDSVPLSAEEAVDGDFVSTDTLSLSGNFDDSTEYTLEFTGERVDYGPNANTNDNDQYRDTVTDHGDGTYTIHGWLLQGTDDFRIDEEGSFTSIDAPAGVSFELNGNSVTRAELLDEPALSPPQNFTVDSVNGDSITTSWDAPDNDGGGFEGYQTVLDGSPYEMVDPDTTTMTFGGLDPSTEYTMGVYAESFGGFQTDTVSTTATTTEQDPITVPRNLDPHSIQSDGFSLDWDAPGETGPGVAEYVIYIDGTEYQRAQTTSDDVTGLENSTTYVVDVTAIDADGNESDPASVEVTTLDPGTIGAPRNLTTNLIGQTTIDLQWDEPSETGDGGVDHYTVFVDGQEHGTTPDMAYTVDGLDPSTQYVVDVTATDAQGNESNTATLQETTRSAETTPPDAPTNLQNTGVTASSASFTFDAPTNTGSGDLDQYVVYLGGTEEITLAAGTTAFTLYGLTPASSYEAGVSAVNTDDEESDTVQTTFETDETSGNHGGTPVDPSDPGCGFGDVF